jgi:hypothetical protein
VPAVVREYVREEGLEPVDAPILTGVDSFAGDVCHEVGIDQLGGGVHVVRAQSRVEVLYEFCVLMIRRCATGLLI